MIDKFEQMWGEPSAFVKAREKDIESEITFSLSNHADTGDRGHCLAKNLAALTFKSRHFCFGRMLHPNIVAE